MKSSRSLDKLFEEAHDDLAILVTRTRQLRRLTAILRKHLDSELAPHCYLSGIERATLTVFVDSAAWATRLRFQAPNLIPALQQANPAFANVQGLKVKVLTQSGDPNPTPPEPAGPSMSSDNANIINSLADCVDDPDLQQALHRLAQHAVKK